MIEIDLTKLLQTSGLVRKKVLVRKKGEKPFWSTRWIQPGADVKDVVRSLGFEVVEEEKRVPTDIVHLQGAGDAPSIPASEVRVGDDRMFNYGGTEKIINIEQKTPKTLIFTYDHIDTTTGKNYTQSVRNTSKVAIKELYDDEVKTQRESRKKIEAEKPKPEIVIPEPVVEVKPEIPIEKPKPKVSTSIENLESNFITPPTIELEEKLKPFKLKTGVNFSGLKKDHVASISDGLEKSIGKYNLKVSYVGWHQVKGKQVPAMYVRYPRIEGYEILSFQKTTIKNILEINKNMGGVFRYTKATNIAGMAAKVEGSRFPSTIEKYKRQLAKYQNCNRYMVANDFDDPLAVMAAHEGYHCVYHRLDVGKKWVESLESMPDYKGTDDPRCCSVSEYGISSPDELFAEVGAAIAYNIDIDPAIKQAFEKTMEGL